MEEILKKLELIQAKQEAMDKKLDELLGHPAEGTIKKSPFGDSIYKDGKWQAVPQPPPEAKIPNGENDPPRVWDIAIVDELAWIDIPNIGKRWYAYNKADNATLVAEIRPFTERDIENHFTHCNKPAPVGLYYHGSFIDLPDTWAVLKVVRNPQKPEPEGCGEDG